MLKYLFSLTFILFLINSTTAQNFIGKLNPYPELRTSYSVSQPDTIKILGIMTDFQEDQDGATFGNGKFGSIYSQNYGNTILDPLPHDKPYFEAHLEFVKNYFSKVSRGKVTIEYFVLPDIVTVSQTMRNYSPPPGSDDFTPIANYTKEVWTLAGSAFQNFNFSEYDIFTIFHAGVGRDVSLPGSIGNERDLPSVYLSDKALRDLLSDLTGLPLNKEGKYNSMIIPETESREIETFGGTFLFQLSINGLLAASVASHLGLPDLFNTETGLSAIGRFGLMDGQAIFAYAGTFPPEPSAWEKIFLRWEVPVTLSPGNYDINLVTKAAAALSDTVILKVPINSSEYFLIENRNRDANNDGALVTYLLDGQVRTKVFTKDTTGFQNFSVDSLAGVILDVDEFDWAIPNTRSVDNNVYNPVPGGGIVIWHIDDNIINAKINENKINTDKDNRGVAVVEADGIPDIGQRFFTIFGDEIIGEGFIEDFWYASNPARFYRNRFSKDTQPNSNSNSGANSLITISDFSDIGNRMSFKVSYGDSVIKPLFTFSLNITENTRSLSALTSTTNYTSYFVLTDSALIISDANGFRNRIEDFSKFKIAGYNQNTSSYVYGALDSTLNVAEIDANSVVNHSINIGERITAVPVININNGTELILGTIKSSFPLYEGKVHFLDISVEPYNPVINRTIDVPIIPEKIAIDKDFYALLGRLITMETMDYWYYLDSFGSYEFKNEYPLSIILTKDTKGDYFSIINTNINNFYGIKGSEVLFKFSLNASSDIKSFALTDLNQDGTNYIILNNGNSIEAYNITGAMADNFPFNDPLGIGFTGTLLTIDFEGDNKSEIISVTKDGRIFAIDGGTGKIVSGFPISFGPGTSVTPALFNANSKANLVVLGSDNFLSAWSISSIDGKLFWAEELGNQYNTSFIDAASKSNVINEFFPKGRVYNYPNPVYDNQTYIRYYVAEDSKINIKVFDLAGGFVAELNDDAAGGFDNETAFDVSGIQSGVYLARIEATGSSGKTESNIIKIAIVK